jgi:hypothetical protein
MRFRREITPAQERTARDLGATEGNVRPAAAGRDCFVYVTNGYSTVRYQVEERGGIVNHTVLRREVAVT